MIKRIADSGFCAVSLYCHVFICGFKVISTSVNKNCKMISSLKKENCLPFGAFPEQFLILRQATDKPHSSLL
jgi:hypothetical protein